MANLNSYTSLCFIICQVCFIGALVFLSNPDEERKAFGLLEATMPSFLDNKRFPI